MRSLLLSDRSRRSTAALIDDWMMHMSLAARAAISARQVRSGVGPCAGPAPIPIDLHLSGSVRIGPKEIRSYPNGRLRRRARARERPARAIKSFPRRFTPPLTLISLPPLPFPCPVERATPEPKASKGFGPNGSVQIARARAHASVC